MNVEELKNNFLLSIGAGIKDEYSFIFNSNLEFKKESYEKVLNISNKEIILSNKIYNTKLLEDFIYDVSSNFIDNFEKVSLDALSNGWSDEALMKIASNGLSSSVLYYADYIKFFTKKLDITPEVFQLIMTLTENVIVRINNDIDKVLQKHNQSVNSINLAAINEETMRNTRTMAEASNASSVLYEGSYGYNAISSMRDSELRASLQANSYAAIDHKISNLKIENDNTHNEINNVIFENLKQFNKNINEIMVVKVNDIFMDINSDSNDLTIRPFSINGLRNVVKELNESEFIHFKELVNYYDIPFILYIEKEVMDKVYNDCINNNYEVVINDNQVKLYMYLKELSSLENNIELSKRLYEHFTNLINKEGENKDYNFDSIESIASNCKYLTSADKEEFKKYIKEKDESIIKARNDHKIAKSKKRKKTILKLLLIIVVLIILAIVVYNFYESIINIILTILLFYALFCAIRRFLGL